MIEDDKAVVETDVAIGKLEVIRGAAREFRFNKISQVVAPITEAAPQWKWQVEFLQQFAAGHQAVQNMPGIAKVRVMSDEWRVVGYFATGAAGAKG